MQLLTPNQAAVVGACQLPGRLGERLVRHDDRLMTSMVRCPGNDLLYRRDADGLRLPLALDRHAGVAFRGDQVHPVVAAAGGVRDTPAPGSKLCRDEFFELHTRHRIDGWQIRPRVSKISPSLPSDSVAVPLDGKPQEDDHRQDKADQSGATSRHHAAGDLLREIPRER
jgi:hypothetical protein